MQYIYDNIMCWSDQNQVGFIDFAVFEKSSFFHLLSCCISIVIKAIHSNFVFLNAEYKLC